MSGGWCWIWELTLSHRSGETTVCWWWWRRCCWIWVRFGHKYFLGFAARAPAAAEIAGFLPMMRWSVRHCAQFGGEIFSGRLAGGFAFTGRKLVILTSASRFTRLHLVKYQGRLVHTGKWNGITKGLEMNGRKSLHYPKLFGLQKSKGKSPLPSTYKHHWFRSKVLISS